MEQHGTVHLDEQWAYKGLEDIHATLSNVVDIRTGRYGRSMVGYGCHWSVP